MKNYKYIKYIILIIACLSAFKIYSQTNYYNDWINYNQQYFRITVNQDGIYRINYSQLQSAGIPVNTIDPRNIQVFFQGVEQYIYIKGENSTGIFDPNGYIEFYGQRNRGYLDKLYFDEEQNQINPDYSFYNDTSSYFLTWNNSTNNKRMQIVEDFNFTPYLPTAPEYFFKKTRVNYTSSYYWGSSKAVFSEGVGYFDNNVITESNPVTKTIATPNIDNQIAAPVEIEIAVAGVPATQIVSTVPHHLIVELENEQIINEIYYGYEFVKKNISLPASNFESSLSFRFTSNDQQQPDYSDRNAVSYIQVKYPHVWDFANANYYELYLQPNNNAPKDYLNIKNFNNSSEVIVYDIYNGKRIKTYENDGDLEALVANTENERFLIITNDNGVKSVNGIHKISDDNKFVDYIAQKPNADYFIVTHKSLLEAAQEYANYRESSGYRVTVLDIDQLYYQYAHGVVKHPAAMKNFADYSYSLDSKDKYMFIIGKGLHTRLFRNSSSLFQACLIPSAGNPVSDNLITAGLHNTIYEPLFPIGRLAARNQQQVLEYLNKVIEYESNPPAEWMKNIIHFGGGANSSEQTSFATYLNNYKRIIEDTLFGGLVSSFHKTSSDPIQITISDSVRHLIENGCTMMTFFGHASATGFDQSIDNPENYINHGKYPFLLANSCFSGDIHHTSNNSVSERWVLLDQKGTIGFLATVGDGIASYLNAFSSELYKNIAYESYNQSIGYQVSSVIKKLHDLYPNNPRIELTCHEFTLHGDPAIVLNSSALPDLEITSKSVEIIPNEITTGIDTFDVKLIIKNIGKSVRDTFLVTADRILPNGNAETYYKYVAGCNFSKTVNFRIPVNRREGPGMNRIRFFVDANYNVEELNESNNEVNINFFIKSGDLYPVYPYNYAIYPRRNVTLKASTVDIFTGTNEYIFRLDTVDTFNSSNGSALAQGIVESQGGIVSWEVPFDLAPQKVYFWKIAQNISNQDSLIWKESSFIYIPDEEGWSQAHFHQFKENQFRFLEYQKQERKLDFVNTPKQLHCYNTTDLNSNTYNLVRWTIDGAVMNGDGDYACSGVSSAIMVVVIDPHTLKAWDSERAEFGHRNYPRNPSRGRNDFYYVFSSGSGGSANISSLQNMNSLLHLVPEDYYILVYSWGNGYFSQWPENIRQTFESYGSVHIRNVPDGAPYIFFTKKGTPNQTDEWEVVGSSINNTINLYVNLDMNFFYGNMKSVTVGPSNNWQSFHWDYSNESDAEEQEISIDILGLDQSGDEVMLIEDIVPNDFNIYNLENDIDYQIYPYLKLDFFTSNQEDKVPAQLKKWQLKYEPVAETAIDPSEGFYFCCDTIFEGEEIVFAVATKNISDFDMDTLHIRYWLQDSDNNSTLIDVKSLKPHPSGDVIIDTVRYSSLGLSGLNSIWAQYNPVNDETNSYYQLEQYYFNNIATKYFYVQNDNLNPVLDVSFDGKHIMDGEIVSAKPEILIKLKDENKFLELNDTSLFRIFITNMETGIENQVFFSSRNHPEEELVWIPAVLPDNSCQIIYKPVFYDDGIYQLRVQAKDISQNESGKNDYVVRFEVINNATITDLLNYPNPFSTNTRFVFELTGSEIPDDLRIEIFTVTGRLVKVIYLDELGPIRIGRNITEYAWNGKDMYGDQLANGIYFYSVKATINGQSIEKRSTEADKYFKNNIGKMYLLR